jgi:hypothetical protein
MKMRRKQVIAISTPTPPALPATSAISAVSAMSWFTQATIILALITFCGYFAAFSYEIAYFGYFRIPYYFISLNPTSVFFTTAVWTVVVPLIALFLVGTAVLTTVLNALEPVGKQIEKRFPRSVKIAVILIAISVVAFFVFKFITDQEFRKAWTVETALIGAAFFALWALFRSSYRRYKENKEETPWRVIALLVAGFFLVLYIEFRLLSVVGSKTAQGEKVFHVYALPSSTSTSEVAVIRMYGEYLYAVPFNRKTNEHEAQFESKLVIVKMSDVKTPLSFEEIGPLKPMKPKQ